MSSRVANGQLGATAIGLHSSCSKSPTASGTGEKLSAKYHEWEDDAQRTWRAVTTQDLTLKLFWLRPTLEEISTVYPHFCCSRSITWDWPLLGKILRCHRLQLLCNSIISKFSFTGNLPHVCNGNNYDNAGPSMCYRFNPGNDITWLDSYLYQDILGS